MRFRIKVRCAELGIRMTDLLIATREALGCPLTGSDFSSFISGRVATEKAERCLAKADEILTEWEAAAKK